MKHKGVEYELLDMSVLSEIGAGKVIDFVPREGETLPILVPKGTPKEMVGLLAVSGPSLEGAGIYDGDVLAFRRNFKLADILPETVCAIFIRSTGEALAKKINFNHGCITLISDGGGFPNKEYEASEIEVQGICFAIVRLADRNGRFPKPIDPSIPF